MVNRISRHRKSDTMIQIGMKKIEDRVPWVTQENIWTSILVLVCV